MLQVASPSAVSFLCSKKESVSASSSDAEMDETKSDGSEVLIAFDEAAASSTASKNVPIAPGEHDPIPGSTKNNSSPLVDGFGHVPLTPDPNFPNVQIVNNLKELEQAKEPPTTASFRFYAFKGGNYNLIFCTQGIETYVWIVDCGFGDGTEFPASGEAIFQYVHNLYSKGMPPAAKEGKRGVIIKSIILTHGHSDRFNTLRVVLSLFKINSIESVILGGRLATYVDTPRKHEYICKALGEIYKRFTSCKFYYSGFKESIKSYVTGFDAKITASPVCDTASEDAYKFIGEGIMQFMINYLGLENQRPLFTTVNTATQFIGTCIYNSNTDNYATLGHPQTFVKEIKYLDHLEKGSVKLVFPVLNPNFAEDATILHYLAENDENSLCLMVCVFVSCNDRRLATVFMPSDAPATVYRLSEIREITLKLDSHHSDSKSKYCNLADMAKDQVPHLMALPMAERLWTPRRGYLAALIERLPLKDVPPHPIFFHILNGNDSNYWDLGLGSVHPEPGFPQKVITVSKGQAPYKPYYYYIKQNCRKGIFTISDVLMFDVGHAPASERKPEADEYRIFYPHANKEPTDNNIKEALTGNTTLNIHD